MKKILVLIMFLLFSTIGLADNTVSTCLTDQIAQHNVSVYNASDMTAMAVLTENETCPQNCSSTMNDCRWEEPQQMMSFLGIIVVAFIVLVFGLWMGRRMTMIDFPIYAIMMMFFALMGGYFDVFLARYNTILLVMTFVPAAFLFYSLWWNLRSRREKRGEDRGTGR